MAVRRVGVHGLTGGGRGAFQGPERQAATGIADGEAAGDAVADGFHRAFGLNHGGEQAGGTGEAPALQGHQAVGGVLL